MLHKAGTTTLDGAGYTYGNAGNRTAKTNYLNNITENYTYDPLYQLTQVTQGTTTTESYSYDAVGNRLSSLGMSPYAYNSSNELTSTPAATFTYDSNGNTLTKVDSSGTTTYTWDFQNRLTSAVLPGTTGIVTLRYDSFGRRIQKSSSIGTTNYLYDGSNGVEEVDQTGALLTRYAQGNGIDELLAEIRGVAVDLYEQDGLGSVTSLSDPSGVLAKTYAYDSFGALTTSTGTTVNPIQYTGRDYDAETGLQYYRARYYDPNVGRFLREDPVYIWSRHPSELNAYAYTRNRPTNLIDPLGQQSQDIGEQIWNNKYGHGVAPPEGQINMYGHWCGPGGWGTTIDELDGFCRDHDHCYDRAHASWTDNFIPVAPGPKACAMRQCDLTLCTKTWNYQPGGWYGRHFRSGILWYFDCIKLFKATAPLAPPGVWQRSETAVGGGISVANDFFK